MSPALLFQLLFRDLLAHQVEYSFSDASDRYTTMVPLSRGRLSQVLELAGALPFAGAWAWAIDGFAQAVDPDAFLLRLDSRQGEADAITLYCRFPSAPDRAAFADALAAARPFRWGGPDPASVAAALEVPGPRGIAFRATAEGLRTAVYFRSEQHAGASWTERLAALLAACGYPEDLAAVIEARLKELYQPGPVGVIGLDDGEGGVPGSLKLDPGNVPLGAVLAFLAAIGVAEERVAALRRIAVELRAESASYLGVKFDRDGLAGWRLYLACEPSHARTPGGAAFVSPRNLWPVRRLPHY